MATRKITMQGGDDYVAIWCDDEMIFCHHSNLSSILDKVCEALGADFDRLDASSEDGDFQWDSIPASLSEHKKSIKAARIKMQRSYVEDIQRQLDKAQEELERINESK